MAMNTKVTLGLRAGHSWLLKQHKPPWSPIILRSLSQKAFVRGPEEPPLLECTIPEHFSGIVRKFGDRNAVISRHQQRILTYHQLDHDSDGLARGLVKQGVRKGDRVAVMLGNGIEFATVSMVDMVDFWNFNLTCQ